MGWDGSVVADKGIRGDFTEGSEELLMSIVL